MLFNFFSEIGKLFLFSVIIYSAIKTVRTTSRCRTTSRGQTYYRSYSKKPSLGDIYYLSIFSVLASVLLSMESRVVNLLTLLAMSFLIIIYCIDAGLCATYNFPLNFSTIKMSFENKHTIKTNAFAFLQDRPRIYVYMIFLVCSLWILYFSQSPQSLKIFLGIGVIIFSTFIITKSKLKKFNLLFWLAFCLIVYAVFSYLFISKPSFSVFNYTFSALGVLSLAYILISLLLGLDKNSNLKSVFFCKATKITKLSLSSQDESFVKQCRPKFTPSDFHGKLSGCNVVFIAFESLGLSHLKVFNRNKSNLASTPFIEKILPNSIFSSHHFCLEPSTLRALKNLYFGSFFSKENSPFVGELNKRNYETIALDMSGEVASIKAYKKMGFKHVFSGSDIVSKRERDYRILDAITQVRPTISKNPFFLHILNSNTHMSYHVVDRQKYNRHNNFSNKGRYFNAIEECDQIFSYTISKIYEFSPPEKTIIVLLGDHGESFGFLNYHSHTSSVTNDQMLVPFLIYHPSLKKQEISFSTHHDVFPTLFDLLGYPVSEGLMGTTALDDHPCPYAFMASIVKSKGLPACFGFFHGGRKYLVDLLNSYFYLLDENDNILETLTGGKKSYILSFLYQGLQERGLI